LQSSGGGSTLDACRWLTAQHRNFQSDLSHINRVSACRPVAWFINGAIHVAHYRYIALAAGILGLGCTDTQQESNDPFGPDLATTVTPVVLVGAGDIAGCPSSYQDEATARLLDGIAGTVFTLGDNVYEDGQITEFKNCYGPSWGRHLARTRPSVGNHEYHRPNSGKGYFEYFGTKAGPAGRSYYSYNLGQWHIIALDSERYYAEQATWLKADLAANPMRCTLAYWHQPYFTSGDLPPKLVLKNLFTILYNAGADVVVAGHNHIYERFAPQDPDGKANSTRGIRTFVVGTGGAPLLPMREKTPNLQVRQNSAHGVLKFSLYPTWYKWEFVPVAGKTFRDAGSNNCH
jgi:acid phosphatase type 7